MALSRQEPSMPLVDAIDAAVSFIQQHPDEMTREQTGQFIQLAEQVYLLAAGADLLPSLPQVPELRPELESQIPPLPPVQFISKLNLPGDWDMVSKLDDAPLRSSYRLTDPSDEPPTLADKVFLPSPCPRWFHDMETLRKRAEATKKSGEQQEAVDYVTLDQAAAMVHRSKRTLEHRKRGPNPLPDPDLEGGGGKPHEWKWGTIRPWLEQEFGKKLPERPLGNR
jgi:hypothetical protein